MSRRAHHLSLSFAALAAGAAAALAVSGSVGAAAPSTASFTAVDSSPTDHHWFVSGSTDTTATIAAGGTVTFGYPAGGSTHNVDFDAAQPSSCTQTAGQNRGGVPPLPASPLGPPWSGTCTFNAPGSYTFHCDLHKSMTGTVVVEAGTSTTSTGSSTTGTSTSGTSMSALPSPRVSVSRRQRGTVVRGSVTTPAGPSRIVVTAFVTNRALGKHRAKHALRVRVGSQTKRSTGTGKTTFAVKLSAAARRALHRRHRLAVSLLIVVTPQGGPAVAKMASVALRDR